MGRNIHNSPEPSVAVPDRPPAVPLDETGLPLFRTLNRGAIVRLRPFLPLGASLTRLGVPYGTISVRDRSC